MLDLLKSVISGCNDYAEIRYHKRIQDIIEARNGALTKVEHRTLAGAGIKSFSGRRMGDLSPLTT